MQTVAALKKIPCLHLWGSARHLWHSEINFCRKQLSRRAIPVVWFHFWLNFIVWMLLITQWPEQVYSIISPCDWTNKIRAWAEERCDTRHSVYTLRGLILFHLVSQAYRFTLHASWEFSTAGKIHSHLLTAITYISIKPLHQFDKCVLEKEDTHCILPQWGLSVDWTGKMISTKL